MSIIRNFEEKSHKLRARAEELLAVADGGDGSPLSHFTDIRHFHELQVHQIELEMQNAELMEAVHRNEELLTQYTSLYAFNNSEVLNLVVDSMQDFILWKDPSGVYRGCNRSFAEKGCGCSREEVIGKYDADFIPDAAVVDALREEDLTVVTTGISLKSDYWLSLPDGSRRCFESLKKPLYNNSTDVIGILIVARDITESRLLRDEVIKSKAKYKALFHTMTEGFALHEVVYDNLANITDFRIIEINGAFERITGLNSSNVVGKSVSELSLNEQLSIVEVCKNAVISGESTRVTRYCPLHNRHYSLYAFAPAPGYCALLLHDKSDNVLAEQALQVSQARMKEAQRIAKLGSWEYHHETGRIIYSEEVGRILELKSLFPLTADRFIALIHPDDREKSLHAFRESRSAHTSCSLSLRLLLAGEKEKYIDIIWENTGTAGTASHLSTGTFQDITDRAMLRNELDYYKQQEQEGDSFQNIVTVNAEMRKVLSFAAIVAHSPQTTVILYGESGCGKGILAKAIHTAQKGVTGRFVTVNCAAIPDYLLESDLFGHKRGAFTGADYERDGKFHWARGGTIFLDEIGDMPFSLQAKLLRVIEERVFEKVGSERSEAVECRIIVATNQPLHKMVAEGKFREDLYHRISVFPLTIPPLRNRMEDLPTICDYLLAELGKQVGRHKTELTDRALQRLYAYHWPGNIRELRNCLERALLVSGGGTIDTKHIMLNVESVGSEQLPASHVTHYTLSLPTDELCLKSLDEQILSITLERCGGNKSLAAKALKIGRSAYYTLK